jgi:PKD repeat protein
VEHLEARDLLSTYSLWSPTATPITTSAPDSRSVEVGVQFESDVAGTISGIRFYKGTDNTGTHVGQLFSSTGQLLASATFTGETASGWQQANFSTPIAITANTTYVAAYHTNVGHYADDQGYFALSALNNGPLHATEGVYKYGSTGSFPNHIHNNSNYWVDVVFNGTTTSTPPVANAGPAQSTNEGGSVTFAGSESGGVGPFTYSWTFGDGATGTGSLTPTHAYTTPGTYTATLTVTDSLKHTSSANTTVTVNAVAPTVNAGGPYSAAPGAAVSFSGSATAPNATDLTNATYKWTFGDGSTATGQNPSHTYATAGSYNVTLTVTETNGQSGTATATVSVSSGSTSGEPLLHQNNLQYLGAFRVPGGQFGPSAYDTLGYGGTALAYNPANNSLFMVGHDYNQDVVEISIPNLVNSSNVNDLNTPSILQWTSPLANLPNNPSGANKIGGLMVYNNQLIGTAYVYYDASASAVDSHFVLSSLNLSTATVGGLYQVGTQYPGLVAGYMTPVPSEWQAALGAPYLTGQSDLSIISRTSSGPAAFGFDPSTLGSGVAPATPYLYYPASNPLGPYEGPADPLQSGTTTIKGAVFVPGSSTVLFFGSTGINYEGYGLGTDYGAGNQSKGPQSLNGEYALQAWAYNANDLVRVKNGTLQPWQVTPYDVWNFTLPNTTSTQIGGVAYDAARGLLYVSVRGADGAWGALPLIEVFQVTPTATTGPSLPHVGTLAVTSLAPAPAGSTSPYLPGPVPQGASVLLTAGNVYDYSPTGTITQVAFYIAPLGGSSSFSTTTDTLLGYGAASTVANANHNWALTISTSGMAPGTYTIFAVAEDASGVFSDPIATTLTIQ